MGRYLAFGIWFVPLFCISICISGCARAPAEGPASAPTVTVSLPIEREVTDYADFTARTAAVESVEVRAHVWGYLQKVSFKEGDLVKEGDVLFEIDPRPYEALLNQAKAKVRQDEAQLGFDEARYQRQLTPYTRGVASKPDLEKASAAKDVDPANFAAEKALVPSVSWTSITRGYSPRSAVASAASSSPWAT